MIDWSPGSLRRVRVLGLFVAAFLVTVVTITAGPSASQERLVSKQDADRIFKLNRAQWEAEARRMVESQTWRVLPGAAGEGTGVIATDPRTGVGVAVQPSFKNQGQPETLVVGSYYPVGTFRRFSDQTRREMESAAGSDFGSGYSVTVAFTTTPSPAPGFDVVEVIITRARR